MPLTDLFVDPQSDAQVKELIQKYLEMHPESPEDAFYAAQQDRIMGDRERQGRPHTPEELNLRDAEHALFMHSQMKENPFLGALQSLISVPGYSGAKALSQSLPRAWNLPYSRSSPPDTQELKWGLAPLLGGMPHPRMREAP